VPRAPLYPVTPKALLPGANGTLLSGSRVARFALLVLSRAAVTLMPWPKGIPVAGAKGSRLLHVAIPLRPKAFYSGSRVAWNQGSMMPLHRGASELLDLLSRNSDVSDCFTRTQ